MWELLAMAGFLMMAVGLVLAGVVLYNWEHWGPKKPMTINLDMTPEPDEPGSK